MEKNKKIINQYNFKVIQNIVPIVKLPTVQHFFEYDILKNSKENKYDDSISEYIRRIKIADSAFQSSILSYAVYSDNIWAIKDMGKDFEDMKDVFYKTIGSENLNNKDIYNLKVWHYLSDNFSKVNFDNINSSGSYVSKYGFESDYTYENGIYTSLDGLSCASVLLSQDENGDNVLNIAFRGTEFSNLLKYIKGPYLNMSAYYSSFAPLIEAINSYANNPVNNIKKVVATGHSLGGAMVQEFLKEHKDNGHIKFEGYTFGSPGSKKKWFTKLINSAYRVVKGVKSKGLDIENKEKVDSRLHEFYHSNDPIPKIGLLGYRKGGQKYNLFDSMYKNQKKTNTGEKESLFEKMPYFGGLVSFIKQKLVYAWSFRFHDSHRYVKNIQAVIENGFKGAPLAVVPLVKESSPLWQRYTSSDLSFVNYSLKNKSAFIDMLKSKFPYFTQEDINMEFLKYREIMKYESKTNIALSAFGENRLYSKLYAKDNLRGVGNEGSELSSIEDRIKRLKSSNQDVSVSVRSLGITT